MDEVHEKRIARNAIASFATPVAAWIGGLAFFLSALDTDSFATQLIWNSVLCGYIAIGSGIAFTILYPLNIQIIKRLKISNPVIALLAIMFAALVAVSLHAFIGRISPGQSGAIPGYGLLISGYLLNILCFLLLEKETNRHGKPN